MLTTLKGDTMVRAPDETSTRLMTRAAILYYRQGLTQQEVAQRLGCSRATAGRVLARAEDLGIVRINISSPLVRVVELEVALEEAFGLVEATVCNTERADDDEIRIELGRGCAEFLVRRLSAGMILSLGWSRTIQHVARFLGPDELSVPPENLTVVQLDGATPAQSGQSHPILGIAAVAERLGARNLVVPAPLYVDQEATAEGLMKDTSVRLAMQTAANSDICLFGIGDLTSGTTLFLSGDLDETVLASLAREGAVGDICGRYFDDQGQTIDNDLAGRTIAVSLDVIRSRPLRVAAVAGASRIPAVLAALRGGLTNVLVTDVATATALLAHHALEADV